VKVENDVFKTTKKIGFVEFSCFSGYTSSLRMKGMCKKILERINLIHEY
jgi:hypothetical protein